MDQYIEGIDPIEIQSSRCSNKGNELSKTEFNDFRHLIGQLNWCATRVRLDASFSNCQLSNASKKPCISDLLTANKTVKVLKSVELKVLFSPLKNDNVSLIVFTDASFANLPFGGSQGAYVIFLVDSFGSANILSWQSRKVRRVCNSTISAECLAAVEAVNTAIFLKELILELCCWSSVNIHVVSDNKSLLQAIESVTPVDDKRLRIDISILQECLHNKTIDRFCFVPSAQNMANALTKQGASCKSLLDVLNGKTKYSLTDNSFV